MRPLFVVFWTALWMVGALHCPLETLGVLPNDFCCSTSASAPKDGVPEPSECSYEEGARWLICRADPTALAPIRVAEFDLPSSMRSPTIIVRPPPRTADESSLPPRSWQFHWRAALAPRAPTSLV